MNVALRIVPWVLAGFMLSASAWAQNEALSTPSVGSMLLQVTGALLLVTALIIGAGWLAKRFSLLQPHGDAQLKALASLALGRKEKVVIVEAAGKRLLLGVASGNVNFLCDLSSNKHSDSDASELDLDANSTIASGENPAQKNGDKPLFSNFLNKCIGNNHRES